MKHWHSLEKKNAMFETKKHERVEYIKRHTH